MGRGRGIKHLVLVIPGQRLYGLRVGLREGGLEGTAFRVYCCGVVLELPARSVKLRVVVKESAVELGGQLEDEPPVNVFSVVAAADGEGRGEQQEHYKSTGDIAILNKLRELEMDPKVAGQQRVAALKTEFGRLREELLGLKAMGKTDLAVAGQEAEAARSTIAQLKESLGTLIRDLKEAEKGEQQERKKSRQEEKKLAELKRRRDNSITTYKENIAKIVDFMKTAKEEEAQKKLKIEEDLEKTFTDIREKIKLNEEDTKKIIAHNEEARGIIERNTVKIASINKEFEDKLKETEKPTAEKQELQDKVQALQAETEAWTRYSARFGAVNKYNLEKKYYLMMMEDKLPEYAGMFDRLTANLDSYRQELIKGGEMMAQIAAERRRLQAQVEVLKDKTMAAFSSKMQHEEFMKANRKDKAEVKAKILELQEKRKAATAS